MPWSGGVYTRGYPSWSNDAASNLPISSTKFDTEDNDFAAGLNNCLTKDGLVSPTSTLSWSQTASIVLALLRGSDGAIFSAGRSGGTNNPVLQITNADATGIALNLTTAQQLALAIGGTNALTVSSTRNVAIPAPASGDPLTITTGNSTGNNILSLSGLAANRLLIGLGRTAREAFFGIEPTGGGGIISGSAAGDFSLSTVSGSINFNASNGGAAMLKIGTAGNITVAAPSSGSPLTVNGNTGGGGGGLMSLTVAAAAAITVDITNTSAAAAANTYLRILNSADNVGFGLTSTGFTGHVMTGDPSGEFGWITTSGAQPLCLGANSTIAMELSTSQEVGIVTPSTIGNLASGLTQAGYMDMPVNSQTGATYTLALTDRGKGIQINGASQPNIVIPANASVAFPVGTVIMIQNSSGANNTISITTDTLQWLPSAATGTRTLAFRGLATLWKVAATTWYIWGFGIS